MDPAQFNGITWGNHHRFRWSKPIRNNGMARITWNNLFIGVTSDYRSRVDYLELVQIIRTVNARWSSRLFRCKHLVIWFGYKYPSLSVWRNNETKMKVKRLTSNLSTCVMENNVYRVDLEVRENHTWFTRSFLWYWQHIWVPRVVNYTIRCGQV